MLILNWIIPGIQETVVQMNENNRLLKTVTMILILMFIFQYNPLFSNPESRVQAEPEIIDNFDFTITALWDFEEESDYDLYNLTMKNSEVNLSLEKLWWNQTTQTEFDSGIYSDTISAASDDVILDEEIKDVNIINNGDFSQDMYWTYQPGDNLLSFYNSTEESALVGYSYKIGPKIIYLNPPTGADDGHVSFWTSFMLFQISDSESTVDIGFSVEASNNKKKRGFSYFDISDIPPTATVDDVTFYAWLQTPSNQSGHLMDIHALDLARSVGFPIDHYIDCENGSLYINDSSSLKLGSPIDYVEWNLGAQAVSDLQNNLSRGWFGIGMHEEGDDNWRGRLSSSNNADKHPQLNISYTTTQPVSLDEIAYVNQTFYKPNVTPNDPAAANLKFDYKVDKFLNTTAELMVEIDGNPVWGPSSISGMTGWTPISMDVGQYMTAAKDYEISLQLHMDVAAQTHFECEAEYDNVNITTLGYSWSGMFESEEFDPQTNVSWGEIAWNFTTPTETGVTIRTQNSPDGTVWDDWSYEYSNPTGDQISSISGRKIKYSANLSTTNYTKTPVVHDVSISYEKYHFNGIIEMKTDFEPANLRNWGTFSWDSQNNGQGMTYWYSLDSGATWNQTMDGDLSAVSISTGKIRFKTEFTTSDGIVTPTLLQWNLTYEISQLPTILSFVEPVSGYIDTNFNFTVRYSDPEDDAPDSITLNITKGASNLGVWDAYEVDVMDTNYTDGKWYYVNLSGFLRGSNYTFHFAAKDPGGVWSIGDTINGPLVINSFPKIITENKFGAQGGILYYNEYEADDLEDEANLVWSCTTNATWLVMDPITGNLSGTPLSDDKSTYWVNVRVDDGHGGSDEVNFTLTVGDIEPPSADAGVDRDVYEDDLVIFNGSNSTDNVAIINFTWLFGDGAIGFGPTPSHTYTKSGNYVVALTVKDVVENDDIDILDIIVRNRPPVADAGPDFTVNEGELVYYNASNSSDTPSDINSLEYLWDFNEDGVFKDNIGVNVSYTWYEPMNPTVYLRVVDDDGDYSEDSVNVVVNNIPPIVDIKDNYDGERGNVLIIIASAYDPGNMELLFRWDWENDGIWDTNFSSDNIIEHAWEEEGLYTLVVEVWDGTDFSTDTAQVEITRHNIPPILEDLGSRQIRYNNPYTIDLTPFISDPDTTLSQMTVITNDPEHVSISGLNITLIYPEDMIGDTVDVTVSVSDGMASDSSILTVLITQNYPPSLKFPIPDVEFKEDGESVNAFNLNDHFEDIDEEYLEFEFILTEPNLIVIIEESGYVTFKTAPNWAGNAVVRFLVQDPSEAFADDRIMVTVTPVNDAPLIINQISYTSIDEDGNWTIDLDDFFLDVDTFNLTFTCNYPQIKIDPITHEAVWVPGDEKLLDDVKFTAYDGEHKVSLDPVDLKVVGQNGMNWPLILLIMVIVWVIIFLITNEIRNRHSVEEVFLVDNAGVLLVHLSQWESKAIDAKLVSGMLTAVQEFVKDSFRGANGEQNIAMDNGALGKLEYGDFKIVIERGAYSFLAAVISGNDNKRLRRKMKNAVDEFESRYSSVLADWDGDMARFDGAEKIVGSLLKSSKGIKIIQDEGTGEIPEEETVDSTENFDAELPHGDFGDIPSYYDESEGVDINEPEDTNQTEDDNQTER
jgi:hypothetical protein